MTPSVNIIGIGFPPTAEFDRWEIIAFNPFENGFPTSLDIILNRIGAD
jgi:hypothetical protein